MASRKSAAGRPPRYKSVAEMQAKIDAYFAACEGKPLLDSQGKQVLYKGRPVIVGAQPPTVTGLALALGFASRQALLNYQGRKQFHDTITRAKARCEAYTESRLYDRDGTTGAQFSLKCNFGWNDKASADTDGEVQIIDDL